MVTGSGSEFNNTVLAGGLRRVLITASLAIIILIGSQILAVMRLQEQIDHWAWSAEADSARERLQNKITQSTLNSEDTSSERILGAFDDFEAIVSESANSDLRDGAAGAFSAIIQEARERVTATEQSRKTIIPFEAVVLRSIEELQRLTANWALDLREQEQASIRRSDALDGNHRRIN
ncbi:hypothetical protein GQ651_10145 [Alphaproteobacteria bacterium GH1-50]|uniref:Uncharacterized protein n=1 Tax=Kangsaoukella pontilimi TaxID=2691042 RepID=A0A7C9IQW8_9RHOB|nr:hypothetical protein [Kangsaoukella pontilimi]MXQ08203.1 hypothetical protein [Kangsaoukella pontilimi]